jgi:hypothetical protein
MYSIYILRVLRVPQCKTGGDAETSASFPQNLCRFLQLATHITRQGGGKNEHLEFKGRFLCVF